MTIIWLILALAGCLVVQAFFAASEIALTADPGGDCCTA